MATISDEDAVALALQTLTLHTPVDSFSAHGHFSKGGEHLFLLGPPGTDGEPGKSGFGFPLSSRLVSLRCLQIESAGLLVQGLFLRRV